MNDNRYVPREQYEALLGMAARQRPRRRIDWTGLFLVVATIIALFFIVVTLGPELLYNYGVPEETIRAALHMPPPQVAPARAPTAPPLPPPSRPVIAAPSLQLPDCATVADTTTACVRTVDLAPPTATEAPVPAATEVPAAPYESACITPPGARPCWLPADQAWSPPAEVPATPIVLVDNGWHPPMAVKCADWHPPQPYPEGCGE